MQSSSNCASKKDIQTRQINGVSGICSINHHKYETTFSPSASASQPVETPSSSPDLTQSTSSESAEVVEAPPQPEIVIGTFQGRWAIRFANLEGVTVSIRAGGNWYKFDLEQSRAFFSRKSIVGIELPVTVWINGQLTTEQSVSIAP